MAGKGDSPRPVDGDTYRANYERIFTAPKLAASLARVLPDMDRLQNHEQAVVTAGMLAWYEMAEGA